MSIEVDDLVIRIRADVSELEKGIKKTRTATEKGAGKIKGSFKKIDSAVSNTIKKYGSLVLAATAAVVAFKTFGGVLNAISGAQGLERTAKNLGLTVEQFGRLDRVVRSLGGDSEALADSIKDVNERIADAAINGGTYEEALNLIGIKSKEVMNLRADEQFEKVAAAIQKMTDQGKKNFVTAELMADAGFSLLGVIDEIGGDFEKASKEVDKFSKGLTNVEADQLKEVTLQWKKIDLAMEDAFNSLSVFLASPIGEFADGLTDIITAMNGIEKKSDISLPEKIKSANKELAELWSKLQKTKEKSFLDAMFSQPESRIREEITKITDKIVEMKKVLQADTDFFSLKPSERETTTRAEDQRFLDDDPIETDLSGMDTGATFGPIPPPEVMTDLLAANFELFAEYNLRLEEEKARFLDAMLGQEERAKQANKMLWESGFKGRLIVAKNFFGMMSVLMETENRKQFEIGKAAAIGQAGIDTFRAAQGAYAAMSGIHIIGPALGVAAAAAAVAAGVANVQKIKSTTMGGGGASGGGGGLTPSVPSGGEVPGGGASTPEAAPNVTNANINLVGDNFSAESVRNLIGAINEQTDDNVVLRTN